MIDYLKIKDGVMDALSKAGGFIMIGITLGYFASDFANSVTHDVTKLLKNDPPENVSIQRDELCNALGEIDEKLKHVDIIHK
jgi:hypothetical protein